MTYSPLVSRLSWLACLSTLVLCAQAPYTRAKPSDGDILGVRIGMPEAELNRFCGGRCMTGATYLPAFWTELSGFRVQVEASLFAVARTSLIEHVDRISVTWPPDTVLGAPATSWSHIPTKAQGGPYWNLDSWLEKEFNLGRPYHITAPIVRGPITSYWSEYRKGKLVYLLDRNVDAQRQSGNFQIMVREIDPVRESNKPLRP